MKTLWEHEVNEVRRGRVEYGEVFPVVLSRRAFCRCCGQSMPKGTKAIRFGWDFKGCGSWTVVECSMHAEPCEPVRKHGGPAGGRGQVGWMGGEYDR